MDHPCTSNKWEVQELSLQFSDPRVSLLPGFQETESWPVHTHTSFGYNKTNNVASYMRMTIK